MAERYDVIVVGSGPGGATVARQMARSGRRVLLLEKGDDRPCTGSYLNALRMFDRFGFLKSREGLTMLKATTTGGATMVYSASAALPPDWLKTKYRIDLEAYAEDTMKELGCDVLPAHLAGEASTRIMDAGNRLGQAWEPMAKLLDPKKFRQGKSAGARMSLGLNYGERWTARDFVAQAVAAGARLMTGAECTDILADEKGVRGVTVRLGRKNTCEFHADTVVLSAGGIPTPVLLQKAGISGAGQGCVMDPVLLVYGIHPVKGSWDEPPVSVVSWKWYDSHGIRLGTMIDPMLMTFLSLAKAGWPHLFKILKYHQMIGVLVKIKDELGGAVDIHGEVSKKLTEADMDKIEMGARIAEKVLVEAGCHRRSIVRGEIRGAHPSGTCRIGEVVDENLETRIRNLYVCDASIFPEALDRPTVITLISFAKRLGDHLLSNA